MIILSSFLLVMVLNLNTLRISLSYGIKKIHLTKSIAILLAAITSIGTFLSMYIGKLILFFFSYKLGNVFGGVLLSFTGIYFIVEYIRLEKKRSGYDTSYFFESTLKYKAILENPNITVSNESNTIDVKKSLKLSFSLILNNLCPYFAASITGIDLSLSVFFNFIIALASIYLGHFNNKVHISKWFEKYSMLISGISLIILGIYESFV